MVVKSLSSKVFMRQLVLWTFIHSFNKYLLRAYCGPGTLMCTGVSAVSQTKLLTFELRIYWGETGKKQVKTQCIRFGKKNTIKKKIKQGEE